MKLQYPVPSTAIRTGTYGDNHYGIDWGIPQGTPITAAIGGVVTRAGTDNTGYGDCIWILNGGYLYIYAHLSVIYVTVGQEVITGQKIALSGSTGNSTGPHLHFEMRQANGYWPSNTIDPAPYLDNSEPEPEQPAPVPYGYLRVNSSVVNVRLRPSISGKDIGDVNFGDILQPCGDVVKADGYVWQPVIVWVCRDYMDD